MIGDGKKVGRKTQVPTISKSTVARAVLLVLHVQDSLQKKMGMYTSCQFLENV